MRANVGLRGEILRPCLHPGSPQHRQEYDGKDKERQNPQNLRAGDPEKIIGAIYYREEHPHDGSREEDRKDPEYNLRRVEDVPARVPQGHAGHESDGHHPDPPVREAVKGRQLRDIEIEGKEYKAEPDRDPRICDEEHP